VIEEEDTDPDPPVMISSHANDWDPNRRSIVAFAFVSGLSIGAFLGFLLGLVIG
jgi:hypothetical protein